MLWCPTRYVMASISTGLTSITLGCIKCVVLNRLFFAALALAALVALYTAKMSLPSTRTTSRPYPAARLAAPPSACRLTDNSHTEAVAAILVRGWRRDRIAVVAAAQA